MNPADAAENAMQRFVFDFLDKFGASLTIVAVILALIWKVVPKFAEIVPELAKVLIDKYKAETELVRKTQEVVVSLPAMFAEFKAVVIAEQRAQYTLIKDHIGADNDKRIEDKVDRIVRKVSYSEPDSDPPPATVGRRPSHAG